MADVNIQKHPKATFSAHGFSAGHCEASTQIILKRKLTPPHGEQSVALIEL